MIDKLRHWIYVKKAEGYLRKFHDFKVLNSKFAIGAEEEVIQDLFFLYVNMQEVFEKLDVDDVKLKAKLLDAMQQLRDF